MLFVYEILVVDYVYGLLLVCLHKWKCFPGPWSSSGPCGSHTPHLMVFQRLWSMEACSFWICLWKYVHSEAFVLGCLFIEDDYIFSPQPRSSTWFISSSISLLFCLEAFVKHFYNEIIHITPMKLFVFSLRLGLWKLSESDVNVHHSFSCLI